MSETTSSSVLDELKFFVNTKTKETILGLTISSIYMITALALCSRVNFNYSKLRPRFKN